MNYQVTIYNKKNNEALATCEVFSENDIGINLKGRIAMRNIIRFDKRKHTISYMQK